MSESSLYYSSTSLINSSISLSVHGVNVKAGMTVSQCTLTRTKCQTAPYSLRCNLFTYRVTPICSYVSKLGSSKLCGSNVIVIYTNPPQHTVERADYDARLIDAEELARRAAAVAAVVLVVIILLLLLYLLLLLCTPIFFSLPATGANRVHAYYTHGCVERCNFIRS